MAGGGKCGERWGGAEERMKEVGVGEDGRGRSEEGGGRPGGLEENVREVGRGDE